MSDRTQPVVKGRAPDRAPEPAREPGADPESIGKYRIIRLLGKGATGSVYLADDPFSERDVAIKVMEDMPGADEEEVRRQHRFFQTEAALAGRLRHPHITSILDAGVDGDTRYLVMEYIEGTSLMPCCDPASLLPVERVVEIGFKCCKALEYANQAGVVHRDIKPGNIMLLPDFDIRIADFGAAMFDRAETTQVSGVGSPAYMSPEQIQSETLNFQTDIFSLGGVLYHLLTGRRPFTGATAVDLMQDIVSGSPPAPSSLRKDVPPALDAIVLRALAKSRELRYPSWEEMSEELQALLEQESGDELGLTEAERFHAMHRLAFFRGFGDVELWEVVRRATWTRFEAGEVLIHEGASDPNFWVLASGMAKVTSQGQLLNVVSPGESVGEMAVIRRTNQKRMATITAMQPSWAIGLRPEDLDGMSPMCKARFNEAFLTLLVDRISLVSGRLLHALQEKKIGIV